jgi:hypothetical protein
MTSERGTWTKEDVRDKVDWEGGIDAALQWGLTYEKIQAGPLRDAWREMELAWTEFDELRNEVDKLLWSDE